MRSVVAVYGRQDATCAEAAAKTGSVERELHGSDESIPLRIRAQGGRLSTDDILPG
jgi:hypothetical protein